MISSLADADVRGHTPALRKKKGGLPSSNKTRKKNTEKNGQGVREVVRRRSCAGGEGGWRACGDRMERGVQPEEWEAKVPQQIRLLLYFVDYSMYVCQQAKNALFLPVFVSFVCPTAPLQLARQHIRLC